MLRVSVDKCDNSRRDPQFSFLSLPGRVLLSYSSCAHRFLQFITFFTGL